MKRLPALLACGRRRRAGMSGCGAERAAAGLRAAPGGAPDGGARCPRASSGVPTSRAGQGEHLRRRTRAPARPGRRRPRRPAPALVRARRGRGARWSRSRGSQGRSARSTRARPTAPAGDRDRRRPTSRPTAASRASCTGATACSWSACSSPTSSCSTARRRGSTSRSASSSGRSRRASARPSWSATASGASYEVPGRREPAVPGLRRRLSLHRPARLVRQQRRQALRDREAHQGRIAGVLVAIRTGRT